MKTIWERYEELDLARREEGINAKCVPVFQEIYWENAYL
jgi:hypothetical protein